MMQCKAKRANLAHILGYQTGAVTPRYVGPFIVVAKRGDLSYQLELPSKFPDVQDVFHVSQLLRCFKDPIRGVDHEVLDIQEDLTYREHPVRPCVAAGEFHLLSEKSWY